MEWRTEGQDNTFHIPVLLDGEFAVPDAGSIKLTIRDNGGAVITGYAQLAQSDTGLSSVSVVTPAAVNSIGASSFETRYIILEYLVGRRPCIVQKAYRLSSFLPIQVTTSEVRGLLGIDVTELSDEDIDVYQSYFLLTDQYGEAFSTALTTGSIIGLYANRALALHTAIELLPALPLRFRLTERADNSEIQKSKVNFATLRKDLETQLEEALDIALDRSADSAAPTIFLVTTPTDVITG